MSAAVSADDVVEVATVCDTIRYYLTARLLARAQGVTKPDLPPAVHSIAELVAGLPRPDPSAVAGLAMGKLPSAAGAKNKAHTKPKPAAEGPSAAPPAAAAAPAAGASNGDGDEAVKRSRGKWTEDAKAELVRLVDDEEYRVDKLGKDANRAGHLNWAALARHFGFSGTAPLHRQYAASTGKDAPHAARPKKEPAEGPAPAAAPAAKKAKTEAAPAAPVAAPAPAAAAASAAPGADWPAALSTKLVRLVDDEAYRKEVTGKRHLKWSRIAEALDRSKKECKKKYTAVTGKEVGE